MDWYKQALEKKDFYNFYALSSLSDEELLAFPIFLNDLVKIINSLKSEYLFYLIREIKNELRHAVGYGSVLKCGELAKQCPYFGPTEGRNFLGKQIYDFKPEFQKRITETIENLHFHKNIVEALRDARLWFKELPWLSAYGGDLWWQIAEYTLKLWNLPKIHSLDSSGNVWETIRADLPVIREYIIALDTLHSLSHNTDMVLKKISDDVSKWFLIALENKKHAQHPAYLALLAKNYGLLKYYHREVFPFNSSDKEMFTQDKKEIGSKVTKSVIKGILMQSLRVSSLELKDVLSKLDSIEEFWDVYQELENIVNNITPYVLSAWRSKKDFWIDIEEVVRHLCRSIREILNNLFGQLKTKFLYSKSEDQGYINLVDSIYNLGEICHNIFINEYKTKEIANEVRKIIQE